MDSEQCVETYYEQQRRLEKKGNPMPNRVTKNMCEYKDGMSHCTCENNVEQETVCKHYERSSHRPECMYKRFNKYCDNVEAQYANKKTSV